MGGFHAVADYCNCVVWDGIVIWAWIGRPGKWCSPCCRVGCGVLGKTDEVVIDDTSEGEFVILEVVQDWIQLHLHVVDVVSMGWPLICGKLLAVFTKSNVVAVAYVDAIVVGVRRPERSALLLFYI